MNTHENLFQKLRSLIAQDIVEVVPSRPFVIMLINWFNKTIDISKGMKVATCQIAPDLWMEPTFHGYYMQRNIELIPDSAN